MGRPTKYKPEYCQQLIEFFDIEPFEKIELPHYQKDGVTIKWRDYKLIPARMPTLRKFAKKIDVHVFRVYCWIDEKSPTYHKEFSDAFTCAKEIRKDWLIDLGLSGLTPPLSYKFTAINVTDMVDAQKFEHNVTANVTFNIHKSYEDKANTPDNNGGYDESASEE